MSTPHAADPVKLVSSLFSAERELIGEIVKNMTYMFGMIDYISEPLAFDYTDYYVKEMVPHQKRRIVSFEDLIDPADLPDIKIRTNEIEETFSNERKRRVNIDPGYISQGNLILATGKPFAHRPYLAKGIYADLTLVYKKGGFHPLEWTYPDYRETKMMQMFAGIRGKYLIQLARLKKEAPKTV